MVVEDDGSSDEGLSDKRSGNEDLSEKDLMKFKVSFWQSVGCDEVAYMILTIASGPEQVFLKKPCLAQEYYNVWVCALRSVGLMRVRDLAHDVMRWIRGEDDSCADGWNGGSAGELVNDFEERTTMSTTRRMEVYGVREMGTGSCAIIIWRVRGKLHLLKTSR